MKRSVLGDTSSLTHRRAKGRVPPIAAFALASGFPVSLLVACSGGGTAESPADAGPPTDARVDAGDNPLVAQKCSLSRPTTRYTAGTPASADGGSGSTRVVPCFSPTGFGASEASLGIASDGTILLAPAYTTEGVGVARSRDYGATWEARLTNFGPDGGHGRVQPFLYLDPSTDRAFFVTTVGNLGPGFDLSWSADKGDTWNHEVIAKDGSDWMKIFAGPRVSSPLEGYPDILYASVPSPSSTVDPDHQDVYRSTNGGLAWTNVAGSSLTLVPANAVSAGITTSASCPSGEQIIFSDGAVGHDGAVYLPYRLCDQLALGTSRDEGATWKTILVPGAELPPYSGLTSYVTSQNILPSEPLAVDSADNIYMIWNDPKGVLHLTISRDQGQTWSGGQAPLVVSAPDVKKSVLATVAVKAPGTIAIAYFGTVDGKAYDGYIAESTNALDAAPVFVSAIVNDPTKPLFSNGFDNNYLHATSGGDLDEFVQVKYAPDGDVVASFLEEMCVGTSPTKCSWDYAAHANSVFQGAIGRLVHEP